jgi:hypothetical protein
MVTKAINSNETIPKFTIHGLYNPSKYGLIVVLALEFTIHGLYNPSKYGLIVVLALVLRGYRGNMGHASNMFVLSI